MEHPIKRLLLLLFGNGAGNHDLVLRHESGLRVPVCTLFLLVLRQSTALYSLLSSCFKIASHGEKWSNYVHNHISDTQGVKTTPFCAGTLVLILVLVLGTRSLRLRRSHLTHALDLCALKEK